MKRDIYTGMKRTWVRQQAKEFAITGAFENFDKVVQAMQLSGVEGGLDAGDVLKDQRTTINMLCTRSRRNMNRTRAVTRG